MNNNKYENQVNAPRRRKRRMSAKSKAIIAVILLLYAVVLGVIAYRFITNPPDTDDAEDLKNYMTDENGAIVTDENGNKIVIGTLDYRGKEGEYNILLLGHDKKAMLTDVIMIINVNGNENRVSIMQIPRDTFVRSVDGVPTNSNKANELFVDHYNSYRRDGEKEDAAYRHALETTAELLSDSLVINIDFAAIMDLKGFRNIVDAIGGVEMDVPYDMYYPDPEQDLFIDIKAGPQTLNGAQAEGFVRFRDTYIQGDLGRVNAQKLFLMAFFNKLKSSVSITNIPTLTKLAGEVADNLVTTMKVDDIIYFAKCALKLDVGNITMMTMPGQLTDTHYVMNRAAVLKEINKYFNTFDGDIVGGVFDTKGQFNDPGNTWVNGLYYANEDSLYAGGEIFGGDDIEDGDISVPLK